LEGFLVKTSAFSRLLIISVIIGRIIGIGCLNHRFHSGIGIIGKKRYRYSSTWYPPWTSYS